MQDVRIKGLNHITLAVADLARSIAFYRDGLGCNLRAHWRSGAYLEAGSLWLCLSLDENAGSRPHPDYSHIAFDAEAADFPAFAAKLRSIAPTWRDNRSEGASLYVLDPDGHKLEIHCGSLQSRLDHYKKSPPPDYRMAGD